VTLAASFLLNLGLKELFALPRPYDLAPGVAPEAASAAARATASGYGFPSGHTQSAATFGFFLAFRWRRRWLLGAALAATLLVGLSRIYLGVHFPADVAGGALAGLGVAALGARVPELPRLRGAVAAALGVVGLAAAAVGGGSAAQALGLAVGALVSRGGHAAARTRGRRLAVAAGGLALLGALYAGLDTLLGSAAAWAGLGEPGAAAALYLRSLTVVWVTLDLWPGWVLGREAEPAPQRKS
jgi:membrane-associated phospholipid phosphatase